MGILPVIRQGSGRVRHKGGCPIGVDSGDHGVFRLDGLLQLGAVGAAQGIQLEQEHGGLVVRTGDPQAQPSRRQRLGVAAHLLPLGLEEDITAALLALQVYGAVDQVLTQLPGNILEGHAVALPVLGDGGIEPGQVRGGNRAKLLGKVGGIQGALLAEGAVPAFTDEQVGVALGDFALHGGDVGIGVKGEPGVGGGDQHQAEGHQGQGRHNGGGRNPFLFHPAHAPFPEKPAKDRARLDMVCPPRFRVQSSSQPSSHR